MEGHMRATLICGLLLLVCLLVGKASAQTVDRKFEAGGVFTSITLTDFKARRLPTIETGDSTVKGLGGRLAYNINNHFAIDGEGTFFPETHFGNEEFGEKLQGFVGIKAGVRNKRAGVFAKARPGVMVFGDFSSPGTCTGFTFGSSCTVSHEKDFAFDVGGVGEFYPTDRAIVRVDVGDTIIRYQQNTFGVFNNPSVLAAETKHNFQISIGFGWRF
jgi:outer membrane protein with beta-barrel domain